MKDQATIGIDTSGISLHKRGYRRLTSKAPITETLAAALLMLTPWNKDRILVDPFCGSGTFPIEAALMAANIAPGMNRSFLAEEWKNLVPRKHWYYAHDEAESLVNKKIETDIQGYDLDSQIVKAARENARCAGVESLIHFQARDVKRTESFRKVWIYRYQSAIRRTSGRKGKAAGHLYQPGRKICSAGFLVYVCDHSVSRDRKIYRKKGRQKPKNI